LTSTIVVAQRPAPQNPQGGTPLASSTITIKILSPDGTPFLGIAAVSLINFGGSPAGFGTLRSGEVQFPNVAIGQYTAEVVAPGYKKLSETVELSVPGQNQYAFLTLVPDSSETASTPSSSAPLLAPNAQKDLNKALEAIRQEKPEEARKYLEKLSHSAPGNPDVNYLWGVYWSTKNNWTQAKSYWEKAVQIYPRHAFSLSALAQTAIHDGDLPSAISYLSKAAEAEPSSWRYEEQLASAYVRQKEYEKAQTHAEHAIELGKDRAAGAQILLALALEHRGERLRAIKVLQAFLVAQPKDSHVPAASQLIDSLQKAESSASASPSIEAPAPPARGASMAADLAPPPKWMPPGRGREHACGRTRRRLPASASSGRGGKASARFYRFREQDHRHGKTRQ